jgi:leader peptidase (prepilin peptidase)/N-methyltransferase
VAGVLTVCAGIFGLIIGSFINVVAYRIPLGRSVVSPPSACPTCGAHIRPGDNVPVISWLLLRGRCRDCGARISARYPIVEAVTGASFAATAWYIGVQWVLVPYLWFVGVTIALTLTDLDHQRIPNRILYPSTAVGAVLLAGAAIGDGHAVWFVRAMEGGVAYFALLFIIALAARGGFGMGDVKLAFLLGLFLAYVSWGTLVVGVFAAFVVGGVVAMVLLITKVRGRKDPIAFGPALVAGAWVAVPFAERLLAWYLGG